MSCIGFYVRTEVFSIRYCIYTLLCSPSSRKGENRAVNIACLGAILCLYASTTSFWISIVVREVIFAQVLDSLFKSAFHFQICPDTPPFAIFDHLSKSQMAYTSIIPPCIQTASLSINVCVMFMRITKETQLPI